MKHGETRLHVGRPAVHVRREEAQPLALRALRRLLPLRDDHNRGLRERARAGSAYQITMSPSSSPQRGALAMKPHLADGRRRALVRRRLEPPRHHQADVHPVRHPVGVRHGVDHGEQIVARRADVHVDRLGAGEEAREVLLREEDDPLVEPQAWAGGGSGGEEAGWEAENHRAGKRRKEESSTKTDAPSQTPSPRMKPLSKTETCRMKTGVSFSVPPHSVCRVGAQERRRPGRTLACCRWCSSNFPVTPSLIPIRTDSFRASA